MTKTKIMSKQRLLADQKEKQDAMAFGFQAVKSEVSGEWCTVIDNQRDLRFFLENYGKSESFIPFAKRRHAKQTRYLFD